MKKGKKWIDFIISDPIFNSDHLVCCGTSYRYAFDKYVALLKKNGKTDGLEFCPEGKFTQARMTAMAGFKGTLLWFRERDPGVSIISHECFHATYNVLGLAGVALSDSSEETYAYYVSWLIREIANKVW